MHRHGTRSVLALAASLLIAAPPAQAADEPTSIVVDSANPFYVLGVTYSDPKGQVVSGTKIRDCVMEP
jgi:hypothetical protein